MTSIHPIADVTIVQINDDGLRLSKREQEIKKQQSTESNRDQSDHDEITDKKQTKSTIQTINSKSDELDDEKIEIEQQLTDVSGEASTTIKQVSKENNSNQFGDEKSNLDETNTNRSNSRTDRRKNSISSRSSHSSTSSKSTSSAAKRDERLNRLNKEPSVLDKGQTIFKPIINGITNHCKPKEELKEELKEQEQFTFTWSNLSYFVFTSSRLGLRKKKKFIFNKINGELKSNQLFGLLGPSGAGKSSLLDCLSLKRLKNVSGDIKVNGNFKKYKMAYIPQHDEYFEDLTCLEILIYASRLKNRSASIEDTLLTLNKEAKNQNRLTNRLQTFHHRVAKNVLSLLGLTEQATTYAGRLSGGQKKRLSIAQELVIKPHIVFLDEPTSGLDSSSSYQCISLLSELTKQSAPIAIVCTIHQPNPKTLQLFDQIYVLSSYGQLIYDASPNDVISHLEQENIEVPIHYNPADYLLELASGEYEQSYITKMIDHVKRNKRNNLIEHLDKEYSKDAIKAFETNVSGSFTSQFFTLLNRCFLLTMRNSMLTTNRILSHVLLAFFIGWVFGPEVGKSADCPPKMSMVLDAKELTKLTNSTIETSKNVMDNMASVFFGILMMLLGSLLPTLVTFPLEVKILQKEYFNGWYSIKPYFWARLIADLPLQIMVPLVYVVITYLLNNEPLEYFRFINYTLIFVLTAVVAQAHGAIVSAIFSDNITTAVYLGPITALPLLLFSGFLVRIERMPWIIRPFTYLSYMRFSFEGIVISIYGFNRCGDEAVEQIQRIRHQLESYFANLMTFVRAGIECDDWDKLNLRAEDTSEVVILNRTYDSSNLILDLNSLKASVINESSQQLMQAAENRTDDSGINTLFNNLLDVMFNSQLDDNGKIIPRVMQIFDLKDAFLYRTIMALVIFNIVTRIISYYVIRYKATLRG